MMDQMTKNKQFTLAEICHDYYSNPYKTDSADVYENDIPESERRFVGLKISAEGIPQVNFPLGYHLSADDNGKRKDILLLLNVLRKVFHKHNTDLYNSNKDANVYSVAPYQRIILDFLMNGYYKEREIIFHNNFHGKVDWSRTIKRIKPIIQDEEAIYLHFITRKSVINDDAILTQIHKFCVYRSFLMIGWIYTSYLPSEPEIKKPNISYYCEIVKKKLGVTFNDRTRNLLNDMLTVLQDLRDNDSGKKEVNLGTNRFEYPWQEMIEAVFAKYDSDNQNKADFLPSGAWVVFDGKGNSIQASHLDPDTIMINNKNVYILDAKYYNYDDYSHDGKLPPTASIQKQITYGDHAKKLLGTKSYKGINNIYNAFLLPYGCDKEHFRGFGYAYATWRNEKVTKRKTYDTIYGIYVDTKWLMEQYLYGNTYDAEQDELSKRIDELVEKFN